MNTSLSHPVRRVLSGALTLALASTALAATAPGASAVSAPTPYECGSDGVYGLHEANVIWETDAPEKIYVGDPATAVNVMGTAQLDDKFTKHLWWNRAARSGSGTSAVDGFVGSTAQAMTLATTIDNIPSGGQTTMRLSGPLGEIQTPTTPGTLPIAIKDFTSTITFKNAVNPNISGLFTCTTWVEEEFVDTVQVVSRSTTTLTVTPATEAQSSRAVATVTTAGGSPAGVVTFQAGGESIDSDVINGEATADLPQLPAGTYPVTATFTPEDPELYESSRSQKSLKVTALESTSTRLTLGSATSNENAPTTATATVSTASGELPAGTMTFEAAGDEVVSQVENGRATVTLPNAEPGLHQVVARFVPAKPEFFTESESSPASWRVMASTSVGLSLKNSMIGYEQNAQVSATVRSTSGWVEGEVAFAVGGTTTTVEVVDGQATARLPRLAPGDYDVMATFIPADSVGTLGSSSTPALLTVTERPREAVSTTTPLMAIELSRTTLRYGEGLRITGAITGEADGTMLFQVAGRDHRRVVRDGVASVTVRGLRLGLNRVNVQFIPADAETFSSVSRGALVRVAKAKTVSKLTRLKVARKKGLQTRGLRITGTVKSPQGVKVNGKAVVLVKRGAKVARKVVVVRAGKATAVFARMARGKYTVTMRYLGNKNLIKSGTTRKVALR